MSVIALRPLIPTAGTDFRLPLRWQLETRHRTAPKSGKVVRTRQCTRYRVHCLS